MKPGEAKDGCKSTATRNGKLKTHSLVKNRKRKDYRGEGN